MFVLCSVYDITVQCGSPFLVIFTHGKMGHYDHIGIFFFFSLILFQALEKSLAIKSCSLIFSFFLPFYSIESIHDFVAHFIVVCRLAVVLLWREPTRRSRKRNLTIATFH